MEEKQWADAACRGDEEAFHKLVSSQKRKMYGIAYSYLNNEADALEAIQETICRAWVKCSRLREPAAFVPWLIRILINCCNDELKRRKRDIPHYIEASAAQNKIEMISVHKLDLERAMQRLKPKYRNVLMLKYYQDMTLTEIARILGSPEGTVKTWLHQGLKQVRKHISGGVEGYAGKAEL
ncbi:sigma-70 family RNA polymerase sigma factor [Paenibacillus fonticola]|uniref:sigma-70 family RNA polymerase sigma factor n=1 Tax=Paenibacillus fonticola TaxID=379896 RepID=UPI00036D1B42|nr:sigma-70 family RNA polymerase sigma factor [Paenibacillus fonticola]